MKYKKLYDDLYSSGYHANYKTSHTRHIYSLIQHYIKTRSKVLDIGCSNGTAMLKLSKMKYDMYGIDISKIAIDICKSRNILKCKASSVAEIKFEDNFFDGLVSSDVMEHIDPSEIKSSIKECYRVLKTGGRGVFLIATAVELNKRWDSVAIRNNVPHLHTSIFDGNFWENSFIEQGFRVKFKKDGVGGRDSIVLVIEK